MGGEHLDVRERLLARLATRALDDALAQFEEAGGHGPQALLRLDRAAAEQQPALVLHEAAGHDLRVLEVHHRADRADRTLAVVAGRNPAHDGGAAL